MNVSSLEIICLLEVSTEIVNKVLDPGIIVMGKVFVTSNGESTLYEVISKFSFPTFEIITDLLGLLCIGISPKSKLEVSKLKFGPNTVTLPLFAEASSCVPF